MKPIFKYAVAATLAGALALAAASPSEARGGRNAAAIGGFAAGALIGAAVVGSQYNNGYYGGGYYGGSGYYDQGYSNAPGYYAEPGYAPGYAYEPEPVYVAPRRAYRSGGGGGCWVATDTARGYGYYGPCY